MPRYLIPLLAILSFTIFGVAFYSLTKLDPDKQPFSTSIIPSRENSQVGGNFSLSATNGEVITQDNLYGKLSLVYFGFTFCPDLCPASLLKISQAIEKLPIEQQKKIQTFFITIDPKRDTLEHLKTYVANFSPNFIGLSGNDAEIKQAASAYRVYYAKVEKEKDDQNYLMDHSSYVYLMGKNGQLIVYFTLKTTVDEMVEELKKHL